ncbi:MAG: aldo/keto reductase [Infirmifilum sp.]
MEYTFLGNTGEKISRIGLGAWQFSESWGVTEYEAAKRVIQEAAVLGINLIDTAEVYGRGMSEQFIGKALKELGLKGQFLIATKIPGDFLAEHDVYRAVEKSLSRLQVDTIDLMQVHWPPCWHNIPTCEYMRALEKLVHLGKIRYIGLSNFPPILVEEARSCLSTEDVVSLQVRYNLVERDAEKEIIPYAESEGLTVLAWSPLAKGAVSGKYTPDNLPKFEDVRSGEAVFHPENFAQVYKVVQVLEEIGKKYNKTPVQVALNWLVMSSPTVVPIPGAKSQDQVTSNAGGVGWRMGFEDWLKIEEASRGVKITRVLW